ncbi:polysaccharide deacetylase family protein [Paenibacillus alginolyticus]|uniref:Polysaccharide deacetylase family protein n=1 Tax=Paenibacillus alginolyticus TaxID=59839 RepID=A0ABT4GLV5_9BACL|nr:polysaccharide deacetylase family protein [Paenibacillus alginolyticus]MCY9697193.1 polysaccharide deacetylase family protein [Paenibacillus alginolyticus]MEC0145382.1 polysaccharide deacetylase family protein [Paenibacillus alginolyticus]
MSKLVWFLLVILLVYTILPTLIVRLGGFGVYTKGKRANGIALTFDDGPDPDYTPQLLDLLAAYQVKATFFVLGSKAEKYPELIMRMHKEGHLIGIHNYVHWANALMTPMKVKKQLSDSVKAIENIIGEKPIYYRPPWGIINIFDLILLKQFHMVLWSLMVGDWRSSGGKNRIRNELLSKLSNNDIILLHDSGQTFGADQNAPIFMLEALSEFLEECKRREYIFLRIDSKMKLDGPRKQEPLQLLKKTIVYFWLKWEMLFYWLFNVRPLDPNYQIFYIRLCKYHGSTIYLENDEKLSDGDLVVELHFNNEKLFQMISQSSTSVQLAVNLIRDVQRFLPTLTQYLKLHQEVRGIYGITMIHRGSKQMGFTVKELPKGMLRMLSHIYLRFLMFIFHPQGRKRLMKGQLSPRIVAISASEVIRRYPADSSSPSL